MQPLTPPLLSIIIPTRERAETLSLTLAMALEQSSQNYEIVISDNASSDQTRSVVMSFADTRIHYFNTIHRLSMCDNYEFGLNKARGEYVIFIGDDDGIVPGGIDHLLKIIDASPEARIHCWPLHTYDWPTNSRMGHVAYFAPSRPSSDISLQPLARFVVGKGGWKYYELPSPYHAAVPRFLLDKIKTRTGRVFHSTQPDVFTAMALPAIAEHAINIGYSITFNGRSARSNGADFGGNGVKSNIDRFLVEYGMYKVFPTLYPNNLTKANMIPDAILLACKFFPEIYRDINFNYEAMWAFNCRHRLVTHMYVLRNAKNIRDRHSFEITKFIFYSLVHEASIVRRKLLNILSFNQKFIKKSQSNIVEFARTLELH